jgi:hypothetical protein
LPRFWIKAALAVGLVALADWLVFETIPGAGLGIFALSAALALAMPATWRNRTGLAALTAAAFFAALQIERATPLGMLLFALSIGVAALSPRAGLRDDVWRWAQRLIVAGFLSIPGPFRDLGALNKARSRGGPLKLGAVLLAAVVPVVGGIVFFSLFTLANPVIEEALAGLSLPEFDIGRLMFWAVVAFAVRTSLRPWASQRLLALPAKMRPPAVGPAVVTAASVTASLFVFNAVFALQNGLDIAFLWSGAPLHRA